MLLLPLHAFNSSINKKKAAIDNTIIFFFFFIILEYGYSIAVKDRKCRWNKRQISITACIPCIINSKVMTISSACIRKVTYCNYIVAFITHVFIKTSNKHD